MPPKIYQSSCYFDDSSALQMQKQILPNITLPHGFERFVRKRQNEFIAGRFCAINVLKQLNISPVIGLYPLENRELPLWPNGVVGSITHSSGFARAALAWGTEIRSIGIDTEELITENITNNIRGQILRPEEEAIYGGERDFTSLLTLIFSAKESIYKALNPLCKKFFSFEHAKIYSIENGVFHFELLCDLSDEFSFGYRGQGFYEIKLPFVHTTLFI